MYIDWDNLTRKEELQFRADVNNSLNRRLRKQRNEIDKIEQGEENEQNRTNT